MKKAAQVLTLILLLSLTVFSQNKEALKDDLNIVEKQQSDIEDFIILNDNYTEVLPFKSKSEDGYLMDLSFDLWWDYPESVWEYTRKHYYSYDENNNLQEKYTVWPDGSGPIGLRIYSYTDDNLLDTVWIYDFDDSMFTINKITSYSYDENNNRIYEFTQSWNGSEFENYSKKDIYYDANNNKDYFIEQYWDTWDNDWYNSLKWVYTYQDNLLVEIQSKVWDIYENIWVNGSQAFYTYDEENNNLLMIVGQNWDEENSQWEDDLQRQTYAYDQDNNRIIMLIDHWTEEGSFWYNEFMQTYYYVPIGAEQLVHKNTDLDKDIEDFETTEDDIVIDPGKDDKVLIGVEVLIDSVLHTSDGDLEFTLSHNGISETIIYQAGGDGDNFIGTRLTDRGIDSISNGTAPFVGNYKPENPLSSFVGTDPAGTWTLSIYDGVSGNTGMLYAWGINLIYAPNMGMENELAEGISFEIFPNPAKNKFKVRSSMFEVDQCRIELYDLNGRKLLQQNIQEGNENMEVDINWLESGIYFCKVSTEKYTTTKKIIIQN